MRLKDKIIIVTGSTTGIGKAIAERCAAEGARDLVHGRDEKGGQAVVDEIGSERAVLHMNDVSDPASARRIVQACLEAYGHIDAVVNYAAYVASSDIKTTDENLLHDVFSVNTFTPFLLTKEALPYLQKRKGTVLNIGSINAWSGEPNLLAYSMSKGAMLTMTRNPGEALAPEDEVRVTQINPGRLLTETELARKRPHGLYGDW